MTFMLERFDGLKRRRYISANNSPSYNASANIFQIYSVLVSVNAKEFFVFP